MDSTTTNAIMDQLAEAAWDQLATLTPAALELDEIARRAEISPPEAQATAGSVTVLIMHQLRKLDRQALLEILFEKIIGRRWIERGRVAKIIQKRRPKS